MTYKSRTRKRTTSTRSANNNSKYSVKKLFKPIKKPTSKNEQENKTKNDRSTTLNLNSSLKSTAITSTPKPEYLNSTKNKIDLSNFSPNQSIIKRNLFGIRLNHDQLNRDLKEIWKEKIEEQKLQWNFDFEKLRPVNQSNRCSPRTSKSLNDVSLGEQNNLRRYNWIKVNTYYGNPTNSYCSTSCSNQSFQDDFEEEEEDEALAIPEFYKYQRRLKFSDDKSNVNLRINSSNLQKTQSTNLNLKNSSKVDKNIKRDNIFKKMRSSFRIKRKNTNFNSTLNNLGENLIITLSDNRKDTLRSAHNLAINSKKKQAENTSKDNLKQQSLLDLFKPRPRRTSTSQPLLK